MMGREKTQGGQVVVQYSYMMSRTQTTDDTDISTHYVILLIANYTGSTRFFYF